MRSAGSACIEARSSLNSGPAMDYKVMVSNLRDAQWGLAVGAEHVACLALAGKTYQPKSRDSRASCSRTAEQFFGASRIHLQEERPYG